MRAAAVTGRRRTWRMPLVAATAVVAVAGCGSAVATGPIERVTTARAVGRAAGALTAQSGMTLTFSLAITAAQARRMQSIDHGGALSAAAAASIPRTALVFDIDRADGGSLRSSDEATDEVGVGLRVDGTTPVQIRTVGKVVYLRADLGGLLHDFGASPAVAQREERALDELNARVPGTASLARGGWVKVDAGSLGAAEKQLQTGGGAQSAASRAASRKLRAELLPALKDAFRRHATYTNLGDHGGRTEYSVRFATRSFTDELLSTLRTDLGGDPALAGLLRRIPTAATGISAAQRTVVDVWVKGGRVDEVEMDLNQFAHTYPFAVPLRVMVATGTPIVAPAGATTLQLGQLIPMLGTTA